MKKRLSLRARLLLAFGSIALVGAVAGGAAVVALGKVNDQARQLYEHHMVGLSAIKQAHTELIQVARYRALVASAGDQASRDAYRSVYEQQVAATQEALRRASDLLLTPQNHAMIVQIQNDFDTYLPHSRGFLDAVAKTPFPVVEPGVQELDKLAVDAFKPVTDEITALASSKEQVGAQAAQDSTDLYIGARAVVLSISIFSVALSIILGLRISRSLSRQLGGELDDATQIALRVAAGDLSESIIVSDGDDESLVSAMKTMQLRLSGIVKEIRESSDSIVNAAGEIAQGNSELSVRTERQASSLQQTAASMEQLTATVSRNSESAAQASGLAASASRAAVAGGQTVGQVVETMRLINDSTSRVGDIIGVIDGIAFQTNILALNAAVEAARAGDAGRGFAVVASEVRQLAKRSADAAREIKALIGANVERVQAGALLVDDAGTKMAEIVTSIQRVNDIVGGIAEASRQQHAGIGLIGNSVMQIDEGTQQNAALVEQSAAAAESLRDQASQMARAVSIFQLAALLPKPQ
jgi:methyl-accepting chemotaxis protein